MKIPCTVEVLTLNSGRTLRSCLDSLKEFDDIIVLDGNSTDNTVEIASTYGARIIPQKKSKESNLRINDFSAVRNIGIRNAKHRWFLFIDSDEVLSPEAVEEIRGIVEKSDVNSYFVYRLPRKYVVDGRVIGRSSMYPNYQTRLFHLDAVSSFRKKIHEKIIVKEGYRIGTLNYYEYVPMDRIDVLKVKWDNYAKKQMEDQNLRFNIFFLKHCSANLVIFFKYIVKYILTFLRGRGLRMPLVYEWYNAYYHLLLIKYSFKNMRVKDK